MNTRRQKWRILFCHKGTSFAIAWMEQSVMLNPFSAQEIARDALAGVNTSFGLMNGLITLAVSRTGTWTNGLYTFM